MKYTADLHVHSHYSRATSSDLNLESLYQWAKTKGINLVGTGDFTHPEWFDELRNKLEPDGSGFFTLKHPPEKPAIPGVKTQDIEVKFCLATEISSIYKFDDRVRKNHNLVYAPDFATVERINHRLSSIGNLESDGRPILGLPSRDLLEIVLESNSEGRAHLVPAHIWTPWFSTLGSKAGYDSIDACFRDLTDHLFAVETGLSSDPAMNWRLSSLDRFTLVSNSDAHSPRKLGREANRFDTGFHYNALFDALKTGNGFNGTYEFYPQEGKYHHDGHRKCDISFPPDISKLHENQCPECGKSLTVGVLHRVHDLADRKVSDRPAGAAGYKYIIPLPEVLGEIEDLGPDTKTVMRRYRDLISEFGNEYRLLHRVPIADIKRSRGEVLGEAIRRIRDNEVYPKAGYDGVFGEIRVFEPGEIDRIRGQLGFFEPLQATRESPSPAAAEPDAPQHGHPPVVPQQEESPRLNNQQQKVIHSRNHATIVKAGPGTGKTHTLVEWIVHQVQSGHCRAHQMLSVTFTNKASEELRQRLTVRLGDAGDALTIGTFHAIAWQLLREKEPHLNTIYDSASRSMTLRILFPGLKPEERSRLDEKLTDHLELCTIPDSSLEPYIAQYLRHLEHNGAVDLSGIIKRLVNVLESDEVYRESLQNQFRAIAVDEFQDINPVQYRLVSALGGGDNQRLLAIGDPDQAIYGFRGSDPTLFFRFGDTFDAGEVTLTQNYRSTPQVLEAAGSVIRQNHDNVATRLRPTKDDGTTITVHASDNPYDEAGYILDQVERYIGGIDSLASGSHTDSEHSYGLSDIAVLFRTNAIGDTLFRSFLKAGIPVTFGDGTSFFSEEPFTAVSRLLRLLKNPANHVVLADLLSESYGWSQAQITSLLRDAPAQNLFGVNAADHISEPLRDDLREIDTLLETVGNRIDTGELREAVSVICSELMPDDLLTSSQLLKKETLLELAASHKGSVSDFLEQMQLNPYTDAGRLSAEGIHLLTFHAAKGLEFPVVFIAAAEEEITPLLREGTVVEEERRQFYVAMTRAEEKLQITYARERKRYGELRQMEPSRFLSEIPGELKRIRAKEEETQPGVDRGESAEQLGLF
ncbi:MAG: UvrD-helicase domain-containing protein [Balneolaceae bacterium]|nr:UvrD-helicase domain-containing protein [Balneolaceae bacterium]